MLISIRGTNGSGKSSVITELFDHGNYAPLFGVLGIKQPEAYKLLLKGVKKPLFVLGPYLTPTGGLDRVQPYDLILDLIKKYAEKGHVLFEGVIVSSSYGRVGQLMETYGPEEAVMAFMDTPLEQCIANVKKRRGARDDEREFNPANLTSKYNQIVKSRVKMLDEKKVRVVDLKFGKATGQILDLFRSAK
jgi:hypothetical protein